MEDHEYPEDDVLGLIARMEAVVGPIRAYALTVREAGGTAVIESRTRQHVEGPPSQWGPAPEGKLRDLLMAPLSEWRVRIAILYPNDNAQILECNPVEFAN